MDENYLVTKSNYFIMNSSYDLSLEEQKLILTLASMVQPTDEEFKAYKFRIADFIKLLGISNQSKYTEIPKITKELMKKVFEIKEGNRTIQTAWLSSAIYEKGSGYVELTFNPTLKPYMLKLNTMFTQYRLANILTMKSKYSPRLYEILKCNEFKKQGSIIISVDELKKILKIENIYPLYADFKRKVILRAQKELKSKTDLNFEFEEIKLGRKVVSLNFFIKHKYNKQKLIDKNVESNNIKIVKNIMIKHNINDIEALKIYKSSEGNIEHIRRVYEYAKNKNANNFIALMIYLVSPGVFNKPKKNYNKSVANFTQREYDYDKLEKQLLGWDDEDIDD